MRSRIVAIYGPPGAGKTTTARAIAETLDAIYVSSGDVAREVDPHAIARGKMADRELLRDGFLTALARGGVNGRVVVDGLPRDPGDVEYLPADETTFVLLNARRDILIDRQGRRGRPGDDQASVVIRRTDEQRALMELDSADGWAYKLSGWTRSINTGDKTREEVIRRVLDYVEGRSRTVA